MVAITAMVAFLPFFFFSVKTPKKAKIQSDISSNYYNRCNLLTIKRGKNAKIKRGEKRARRGS
jgi:hypothetical protein